MAKRIATAEEIAAINTWASSLGTVGSMAAVDSSWAESTVDQSWVSHTEISASEDYSEITFTVSYNESGNEEDGFTIAEVTKVFTVDSSLVPDGPDEPEEAAE